MIVLDHREWHPIYMDIVSHFGYSVEEDRRSARLLGELRGTDGLEPLEKLRGKRVEVQGPLMEVPREEIQIPAGSAISRALEMGGKPYMIVTDLDGDTEKQLEANLNGVTAVIHAHGDNMDLVNEWAGRFTGHVISTCQCEPVRGVYNFGGFTDGDRAVFIADHFGAREIVLNGWDLGTPVGDEQGVKREKLRWAKTLLDLIRTPLIYVD